MEEKKKYQRLAKRFLRCKKEREEYLEAWKRARADFINYKKEEARRLEKATNREKENLFLKIILILDNFRRAEKEAYKQNKDSDKVIEVFLQIKNQLESFLQREGIEEIETKEEDFDPKFHEAIEMTEKQEEKSGKIAEEIERGYIYNGKVIRPSKVKVVK